MQDFEQDKEILIRGAENNAERALRALAGGYVNRALEHFQDLILEVGQQIGSMHATYKIEDDDLDDLYFSVEPTINLVRNEIAKLLSPPPFTSNPFCTEEYGL